MPRSTKRKQTPRRQHLMCFPRRFIGSLLSVNRQNAAMYAWWRNIGVVSGRKYSVKSEGCHGLLAS